MAAAPEHTDQRAFERFPIQVKANVAFDEALVACTILNIGADGAKVAMFAIPNPEYLVAGTAVTLNVPGFHGLPGAVMWTGGANIGIQFDERHKVISRLIQSLP